MRSMGSGFRMTRLRALRWRQQVYRAAFASRSTLSRWSNDKGATDVLVDRVGAHREPELSTARGARQGGAREERRRVRGAVCAPGEGPRRALGGDRGAAAVGGALAQGDGLEAARCEVVPRREAEPQRELPRPACDDVAQEQGGDPVRGAG